MEKDAERGFDWVGLPVIATVARLLCQDLTLQNEYLLLENRILKEKVSGRIRFTDEERQSLAEAALAMGRSLMKEVVSIVKPETILAWQRRLEQKKWDYSARRTARPGRPSTPDQIEALVRRLARENTLGLPAHPRGTAQAWYRPLQGLHRRHPAPERSPSVATAQGTELAAVPVRPWMYCSVLTS